MCVCVGGHARYEPEGCALPESCRSHPSPPPPQAQKIDNPNDFLWTSQLRFYWDTVEDTCMIRQNHVQAGMASPSTRWQWMGRVRTSNPDAGQSSSF